MAAVGVVFPGSGAASRCCSGSQASRGFVRNCSGAFTATLAIPDPVLPIRKGCRPSGRTWRVNFPAFYQSELS